MSIILIPFRWIGSLPGKLRDTWVDYREHRPRSSWIKVCEPTGIQSDGLPD